MELGCIIALKYYNRMKTLSITGPLPLFSFWIGGSNRHSFQSRRMSSLGGPAMGLPFALFICALNNNNNKIELPSPDESETITSKFVKSGFKRQLLPLLFVLQLGATLNMPAVS